MNNIESIIKLNKFRKRALRERNFEKFAKFSCKLHKIESADRVPIGSYIFK